MAEFTLQVRLFATLKEKAGATTVSVSLTEPATVAQLLMLLGHQYPALEPSLAIALVAVNKDYAVDETPIVAGDDVALFPPVSGGSDAQTRLFEPSPTWPYPVFLAVTEAEMDMHHIHQHLTRPDIGSVVWFTGTVRGETERDGLPAATLSLEYEAYVDMALDRMGQIVCEIWKEWPLIRGIAIVQRIGKLEVGEKTTLVACASGHRDQGGFAAARYGIDRLKEIVPVWKKEVGTDKSVWVEGDYRPTLADN